MVRCFAHSAASEIGRLTGFQHEVLTLSTACSSGLNAVGLALDAIRALDPERLYATVTQMRISMCGLLPAVIVMQTLRHLGALNECQVVGYTTSAEASGDRSRVVGYAGVLFR